MKNYQIILLVFVLGGLIYFISSQGNLSSYEDIASARKKSGVFVNIIAKLDTTIPYEYDPVKNPNYFKFQIIDSLGNTANVVYKNTKPIDIEKAARIVLKGEFKDTIFYCQDILIKCPSKYKDQNTQAPSTSFIRSYYLKPHV